MTTMTMDRLLSGSILDEQVALETQAVRDGVKRYRELAQEAIDRGDGASLKPAERLLLHWMNPLVAALREERRMIRRGEPGVDRAIYGPALLLVDAERLSVITMHEVMGACLSEPDGVLISKLTHAIGRAVLAEANLDTLKRDHRDSLKELDRRIRRLNPMKVNWWAKRTLDDALWSRRVCVKIGACLLWNLIGVASCRDYSEEFQLAFHHERRWVRIGRREKLVGFVRLSPEAAAIIDEGHARRQYLRPRYLPMLVPPYPWQPGAQGGYIRIRTPFISKPTTTQKAALAEADLSEVYECLNAVNATPWRINPHVHQAMAELWQSGGGVAGVPHAEDFPLPPMPAGFEPDAPRGEAWNRVPDEVRDRWKAEAHEIHNRNHNLRPQRKEFTNKLAVANRMGDRPFYMPHQLDFRGRTYPIPPHLNHQGDDVCRGLLEFAEPRPLNNRASWWLKVHAANCCDVDKVSFDQRVAWAEENMAAFRGWAESPLDNTGWMLKLSGDPDEKHAWQKVAAARALFDPEAGACLPVQLDGTCNGLQHYTAMGRDLTGAAAVNLLPSDAPGDVYADVARDVAKLVNDDAEAGVDEARWVAEHICRDLVKPVVMTSVYGVTIVGARKQLYKKLDKSGLDEEQRYKAGVYLSRVVLQAIGTQCPAATAIMDWLTQCARIIAGKPISEPVAWTTPLGLPVVQPYRKWSTVGIKTIMQEITLIMPDDRVPVAPGRQFDGFAPNFIHSIDATHMFMTARACREEGIAFAAVHDSYWTHAADADRLARILREQFIELHRRPLLLDLLAQFRERWPDAEFPEPPAPGSLDISVVLDSPYLFS